MSAYVYRIENNQGFGCYADGGGFAWGKVVGSAAYSDAHPAPHDDEDLEWARFKNRWDSRAIFGFGSFGQLLAWVHKLEWREGLRERGFTVAVYKIVEDGHHSIGRTQAVFVKHGARLLQNLDLVTFKQVKVDYA